MSEVVKVGGGFVGPGPVGKARQIWDSLGRTGFDIVDSVRR